MCSAFSYQISLLRVIFYNFSIGGFHSSRPCFWLYVVSVCVCVEMHFFMVCPVLYIDINVYVYIYSCI